MRLENSLKKAVLLLSALMLFIFSNAQVSIRLEQAIDSALHNNINFLANNLEIDYAKKMQKTNPNFDKTFIDFGFGQINGFQNDNRFGASQTFHFPTVYKKQASVNASAVQLAETNNLSEHNFVAPYKLMGAQALSVDKATTWVTFVFNAAFITFSAPPTFVLTHSSGLYSAI